jgi:hypothetical protein
VTRLFNSPHLIDLIMAFTVLEAVALILLRRHLPMRRRDLVAPSGQNRTLDIVLMVLPGLCLMAALRAALDGEPWPWVPVALAAAFVTHLADLRRRWRG